MNTLTKDTTTTATLSELIEQCKWGKGYNASDILQAALIDLESSEDYFQSEHQEIQDTLRGGDEEQIDLLARNIIRSRCMSEGPTLYEAVKNFFKKKLTRGLEDPVNR